MSLNRRQFLKVSGLLATTATAAVPAHDVRRAEAAQAVPLDTPAAPAKGTGLPATAGPPDRTRAQALAALNHAGFGPRPGDVERVLELGVDGWLDRQLAPEAIDDSALEARLEVYPSLGMDIAGLLAGYPSGGQPGPWAVIAELAGAAVLRAVYSERQLLEMMVDFWSNHLNIYIRKNRCQWLKTVDDRTVVRRHALGNFGDLLRASAQSPAMLDYLDNRLNVKGRPNENYARELMELHTIGVDGGYTQHDVQELARCLTGWGLSLPTADAPSPDTIGFYFNPQLHDDGPKTVLGMKIPAGGGIQDGLMVLDMLAHHPQTARRLATRLVRRFVSDDPPDALVGRVAGTFTDSGGDIRLTMHTLLHSEEFKGSYGQKLRRPLEFVAATLRGLPAEVSEASPLLHSLTALGQYPFGCEAPDGYPDVAGAWANTSGLMNRWNLARALAGNRYPGVSIEGPSAIRPATSGAELDYWIDHLLHGALPAAERNKLVAYAGPYAGRQSTTTDAGAELVALVLCLPHYQLK